MKHEIYKILAENKKLKNENKKLRKIAKQPESFVQANLLRFRDILMNKDKLFGSDLFQDRYFYKRKRKGKTEHAIKMNVFVTDLIEAKVRLNPGVLDADINSRMSMDVGSLIRHLQKDRIIRPRKKQSQEKKENTPVLDSNIVSTGNIVLRGYAPPKSFDQSG